MPMTNINIRTDSEVKSQAQALFSQLGLDMSTAINMFLRQAVRERALPMFRLLDDGEETLSRSLLDIDSGVPGISLNEFDRQMRETIRREADHGA